MCSAKKDDLRGQGFVDARDVPPNELTSTQQRIQRVSQSGKAELTQEAAHALAALPYPRYYLNFETIHLAVPRWAHTSPYRTQVPFAWSCHVEDEAGHVKHAMFLEVSDHDPCRACAETMLAALGNAGPVFVYSQSFERGRIAELAELYSDLAPALLAIHARIVDLLLLTKISYYHPNMRGSWSIRAVLPTIANDLDKKRLDAGDGGAAQDAFREILHPDTPESRKQALTQGLRDYCTLNTLAMLRLAWVLAGYVDLPKRYPPAVNRFAVPKGGNILLAPSNKPRTPHPDPFFEAAEGKLRNYFMRENVSLINQHVSISLLQRIMHIGFNRTLDVMQHLIDEGVLSPSNSGKIDL